MSLIHVFYEQQFLEESVTRWISPGRSWEHIDGFDRWMGLPVLQWRYVTAEVLNNFTGTN